MRENTRPSIMQNFDTELAALISKSRGVSLMDGLRIFLRSQIVTLNVLLLIIAFKGSAFSP